MYTITGYEHIKSKDGQVFTKVYIAQTISVTNGMKPFPIPFMISGESLTYQPGLQCNVVLDSKQDGTLYISGVNLVEDSVLEGNVIV